MSSIAIVSLSPAAKSLSSGRRVFPPRSKIAQFRPTRFSRPVFPPFFPRFSPRYSHVRMEAKRRALDEIAARQRAADEKRREQAERREQDEAAAHLALVQ
jgi:hypothetical protein